MTVSSAFWPQLAVCVYSFLSCSLVFSQVYGPADPYGHWIIWLWLAPLAVTWRLLGQGSLLLSGFAVVLLLLGDLAQFNSIKYVGLACSVVALLPWSWSSLVWLAMALSWIPAFVLVLNWTGLVNVVTPIRLALALIPTLLTLGQNYRRRLAT